MDVVGGVKKAIGLLVYVAELLQENDGRCRDDDGGDP